MDIRNFYLFGNDIDLKKYGLDTIKQPTYKDFLDNNLEYFDFVKIFYLSSIFNYKYSDYVDQFGIILFLMSIDIQNKNGNLIEALIKSLKILYRTDNVRFIDHIATFTINDEVAIDKDNFNTLSTVVLEMTKTNINYDALKDKVEVEDEIINEFERRKKEYEEKYSKSKSETTLLDIINIVIHYQNNINYSEILNWTVYQIKNTYEVLVNKERNRIDLARQASMKFDVKEIDDWKSKGKLNKSKIN